MVDQVLETFRKATESTMQLQQEMFRQWTQQMGTVPGFVEKVAAPVSKGSSTAAKAPTLPTLGQMVHTPEQLVAYQKQLAESVSELLKKHRKTLDAQYEAGAKIIEEAFKVGQAKSPEEFRRLTEALWKQSFDCLKSVAEDQVRESQTIVAKWLDAVSKGVGMSKV